MRIKIYDLLWLVLYSQCLWISLQNNLCFYGWHCILHYSSCFLVSQLKLHWKIIFFQKCALPRREWKIFRKVYLVWKTYILFSCFLNICLLYNHLCKTVICIRGHTFITSTKKCRFWPPDFDLQQRSHSSNLRPQ